MIRLSYWRSFMQSPLTEYLRWVRARLRYERKNNYLRLGYMTRVNNVVFGKYNWTGSGVFLENVEMGDFSYVSANSAIMEATIGKFCSIGPNVLVAPGKHPTHTFVSTHPALFSNPSYCARTFFDKDHHNPYRHVTIGNDVWICANAVIADGVTIGDGAIVLANAVVGKDVEPYTIVGGVPAGLVRPRFDERQAEFLLKTKWWDRDEAWIERHAELFLDVEKFVDSADSE